MRFKDSPYYDSRVGPAKEERGWLPDDVFYRLGKQEWFDYRRRHPGGRGRRSLAGLIVWAILLGAVAVLAGQTHQAATAVHSRSAAHHQIERAPHRAN
jgi:hypothetical protein